MLGATQQSEMYNTRKNFLISMHTKYRPIKERPILGIDYDKLKFGSRKPRYNLPSNNGLESPQAAEAPKDSIIRNQTSQSFRPQTNHSSLSKHSLKSNNYQSSSQHQIDDAQKVDFETFKKYQKEFMEFRKQKQLGQMQNHFISSQYSKPQKQNFMTEQSQPNVYQRLSLPKSNKLTRSQFFETSTKGDHKRNSLSIPQSPEYQQYLERYANHRNDSLESVKNEDESKPQVQFQQQQVNNGQESDKVTKTEFNIQDQHQQLENADRNYELQKLQDNNGEQQNYLNDPATSENNFSSAQQFFDPNSTQYMKMVDKYMEKNPEYFKHLQGDCICGRCICGKCRCPYRNIPIDFKRGMQTLYQADFQKHKNLEQLPQITMDFHSQVQNLEPIKCCSTTQNDFRPHDVKEPVYHKGPVSRYTEQPFIGSSNYKVTRCMFNQTNFNENWKYSQPQRIPNPTEQTVVQSVPFIGKTMYMENFQKMPIKDREFEEYIKMRHKSKLSPMNPDFRYLNETNYQFNYQGKNPEKTNMIKPFESVSKITPSAPDQYRSTFTREFEDKSSVICPSRIELMELNKKKQQQKYKEYLERERLRNAQGAPVTMNTILSQNNSRPLKTHA